MTLLLRTSHDLPPPDAYRHWLAVTDTPSNGLDPARKLPGLAPRLEQAFDAERDTWWTLARTLAKGSGALLSHTVACGSFGSDFGLMLAWVRLARDIAGGADPVLMVCDDPWLFRQVASLPDIRPGKAPPLKAVEWKLALRGFASRCLLSLRLIRSVLATRAQRSVIPEAATVLMVYGHPGSRADGFDTYFGTLMRELPEVKRVLHTDCPPPRAAQLAADGRTASLHGWGAPTFALTLPFVRWRPGARDLKGPFGWLVRRAAMRENGGGGPAMNRWQMHCQRRFLRASRPATICWPWENHAWERDLCRAAKGRARTFGYQHTVIGPHQINYSVRANHDGHAALPDLVIADGPAYRDELLAWDVPANRLGIGGAWRFDAMDGRPYDPHGPVFVPLSAIPAIARLQVEAARRIAATGRKVLVKEHPMYPLEFQDGGGLERTSTGITGHGRLSAVVYSTGTSGLEGLLLGLPTFRLLAEDRLSIDVLPAGITAVSVTLEDIVGAIAAARPPAPVTFGDVLSPPDIGFWKTLLNGDIQP